MRPPDEVYLWPDNVQAWQCWAAVQTQWRTGMGGATGLDYVGARACLDEMGIEGDERKEVWACLQAAEIAVLELWAERRAKAAEQKR